MNETQKAWALRLASDPTWRWLAGMKACYAVDTVPNGHVRVLHDDEKLHDGLEKWPDLCDAATAGCLLRLLFDACGSYEVHARLDEVDRDEFESCFGVTFDTIFDSSKHLGVAVASILLALWGDDDACL